MVLAHRCRRGPPTPGHRRGRIAASKSPARRIAPPAGCRSATYAARAFNSRGGGARPSRPRRASLVYLHGVADNRAVEPESLSASSLVDSTSWCTTAARTASPKARLSRTGISKSRISAASSTLCRRVRRPGRHLARSRGRPAGGRRGFAGQRRRRRRDVLGPSHHRVRASALFLHRRRHPTRLRAGRAEAPFDVDAVGAVVAASRIDAPVILIHGEADTETRSDHSRRVFDALRAQKRLILVPGAGHNESLRAEVWDEVARWIDSVIPAASGTTRLGVHAR